MNLIDRYVYAVTEYLPEENREDISRELRSNIEDMLPENATEQDIRHVLEELGSPWKLANEYSPKKRYLIGPGYYDKYLSLLKMVIGICASVFAGLALLAWTIHPQDGELTVNLTQLISDIISAVIEGALQGAFWVTLVFAIIERCGVEAGHIPFMKDKWTPEELLKLPVSNKNKISRGETLFSIFFTILFTALLCFQPQLISLYVTGDNGRMSVTPLFVIDRLHEYLFIIILMAIFQLGILAMKYFVGKWNMPLAISTTIYNMASCILTIVILSDSTLFNREFFSVISELTKTSIETVFLWINRGKWAFISMMIIICVADSISAFIKSRRKALA